MLKKLYSHVADDGKVFDPDKRKEALEYNRELARLKRIMEIMKPL